jgi:hypothetical protein
MTLDDHDIDHHHETGIVMVGEPIKELVDPLIGLYQLINNMQVWWNLLIMRAGGSDPT